MLASEADIAHVVFPLVVEADAFRIDRLPALDDLLNLWMFDIDFSRETAIAISQ